MSDSRLQEIVTKAVVGRAERRIIWRHTVPAEGVTGVLGVHVTNSAVAVTEADGSEVQVLAEIDLWCAGASSTKVIRCTARHLERVALQTLGPVLGEPEFSARLGGSVQATGVSVTEGQITLNLAATVHVEMSAVTRLWVRSYNIDDASLDDVEDPDDESDSGLVE